MKNVVFYCHDFYPNNNGYTNAFLNLIRATLAYGKDISLTVITPVKLGGNVELSEENLKVIRLPADCRLKFFGKFYNEYKASRFVSSYVAGNNVDALVVETCDQPFFLSLLNAHVYSKLVIRIHSTSETEYTFFVRKLIYKIKRRLITKIVAPKLKWIASTNSFHVDFVKKYYYKNNLIDIGKVNFFVVPNTIYPDPQYNNFVSVKNDSDKGKIKAVMLGRMEPEGYIQKGFEDLFIALNLLDACVLERFDLKIIGSGSEKERVIRLASGMSCIQFIDAMPHSDIIATLQGADLVILPSRFEGLSMFALEGLSTGNVCLFSETGGLVDLIDRNGFFTKPQDIYSIAHHLERISNLSQKEIEEMKLRSQELYTERFSNEKVAVEFIKVLQVMTISNKRREH